MRLEISREQSLVMRGLAIIGICTSNLLALHYEDCITLFAKSNEMSYNASSVLLLLDNIKQGMYPGLSLFMTWYGIPLFVFLSGYGLTLKYNTDGVELNTKSFLSSHYKKLFLLFLPSFLYFIIVYAGTGNWSRLLYTLFSLSFLNQLILAPPPSYIYWYFSLAFELYLVFPLIIKIRNNYLIIIAFLVLSIQTFFNPIYTGDVAYKLLYYMRHNLWGWLPVFMIGIAFARSHITCPRKEKKMRLVMALLGCCFLFIIVFMNFNYYTWLLSPFVAIIAYFLFSGSITNTKIGNLFRYLGKQSAFLFSAHAVVLSIIDMSFKQYPLISKIGIYLLFLLLLCPLYQYVMKKGKLLLNV